VQGTRYLKALIAGAAVICALGITAAWVSWQYPLPSPRANAAPTIRLYAGSQEIAILEGTSHQSQVWMPLAQIPRPVVDAVLVTEDRRFFLHHGIDFLAVLRAMGADLWHHRIRQGGSTITQQLARTLFLSNKRTWRRKLHEAIIAVALELRYSKESILEAYLNSVYMGEDGGVAVHGMGAAARHFLHKELAEVRLDEAALLAAAISAPNRTPSGEMGRSRMARDNVLQAMRDQGIISEAAARKAEARPPAWRAASLTAQAPYFVDFVREEIARRTDLPASAEIRMSTTLDPFLQRSAEAAVRAGIERIEHRQPGLARGKLQAALVAIEPATGQIRALVGGRQYRDSPFNRATRAHRQPGSLFKPIVYLSAFEAERQGTLPGLTPASLISDEPTTIQSAGENWSPHNLDRQFHGAVTVRRALEESLNVPAVRIAQQVGLDRVAGTALALGITSPLSRVPSLALGTSEVTLLEITSAFSTLAGQGVRTTPTTLTPDQDEVVEHMLTPLPAPVRAVSAESAFLVTHLLRGVMREGTGHASAGWGLSDITAGKSGTTDGLRDAWLVGYTPDMVVGVWVGMDDGSPLGLTGAQAALPIWAKMMQVVVQRTPPRRFTPPPGVVFASVNRDTGRPTSVWCGGGPAVEEAFRAGTEPHGACGEATVKAVGNLFFGWFLGLFR
jgi:penicillin-binding protein 1B